MPVLDPILADLPAEVDVRVATARREVDEALLEILDDGSELLDRLGAARERRRLPLDAPLRGAEHSRSKTAVSSHCTQQRRMLLLESGEGAPVLDHPLGKRPNGGEQLVRLVRREVAGRHVLRRQRTGPGL